MATEKYYLDDFVHPVEIFNNEYFGQQNTTAFSGLLINLTEDFEVILYNFVPQNLKATKMTHKAKEAE